VTTGIIARSGINIKNDHSNVFPIEELPSEILSPSLETCNSKLEPVTSSTPEIESFTTSEPGALEVTINRTFCD
jgi:hypothetical protein